MTINELCVIVHKLHVQYNRFITDLIYNKNLDITQSCCGSQICFTLDFYKGIIGK